MSEHLRYPIGRFAFDAAEARHHRTQWILDIARLPGELEGVLDAMDDARLDTPYRPEGWTVRQLVHHVADSHANAYIRFRLALTEEQPTIKAYNEKLWAELVDSRTAPIEPSLQILEGLHSRWTTLLRHLSEEEFQRTLVHPDNGVGTLEKYTGLYAWHGLHHVAHIRGLRERMEW